MGEDVIGTRIKSNYENRSRHYLPRRSYTILRLDGKSFHTYTKGMERPFDNGFIYDFDFAAQQLVKEVQGAQFAYTQSDECSILITDFTNLQTEAWFDNNIQKMVSVSASIFTAEFNQAQFLRRLGQPDFQAVSLGTDYDRLDDFYYYDPGHLQSITQFSKRANFDSRVFQIPDRNEVGNYFLWRLRDCFKNCISSYAQCNFSPKQLEGKSTNERIQMLYDKNIIDIPENRKYGRFITKDSIIPAWDFGADREKLLNYIPAYP